MQNQKAQTKILNDCNGVAAQLNSLIEYADESVVSKTILDKAAGTITLFAFDKGQGLSEHAAPYDATVQILDGNAQITIDNKKVDVSAGEIIVMPANVPHSVSAKEKFKMLLTMIRA